MSRWKQEFDATRCQTKVEAAISSLEGLELDLNNSHGLLELSRATKMLRLIQERLGKFDPELYTIDTWSRCASHLDSILVHVSNFRNSNDLEYLKIVNQNVDELIREFRPFDLGSVVEEFKSVAEINSYAQSRISAAIESNLSKFDKIEVRFSEIDGQLSEVQRKLSSVDLEISRSLVRIDSAISTFQDQFSSAQEGRVMEFGKAILEIRAQLSRAEDEFRRVGEKELISWNESVQEAQESWIKQYNINLEYFVEKKKQVDEIFGAIGTSAYAGNFRNEALHERDEADLWRRGAVFFMVLVVGVSIAAFVECFGKDVKTQDFMFRISTALVLLIPAAYAANESAKHRDKQRGYSRMHLELASIDAYLVHLTPAKREQIKEYLSRRFFGRGDSNVGNGRLTERDIFGLLRTAVENVTKSKR